MIKLQAAQRLSAATHWWDALSEEQRRQYVKEHPDSEYAEDYRQETKVKTEPKGWPYPKVKQEVKKKAPVKPKVEPKPKAEPKPKPKVKPQEDDEVTLIRHLLKQGDKDSEKKVKNLLKKGGHELLKRLLLTPEKKPVSRKPATVPKSKSEPKTTSPKPAATKPKINRLGKPAPSLLSTNVQHMASPQYKKSGIKGISPYGYWKDSNTWVSETKEEWEKKLTPEERKKISRK